MELGTFHSVKWHMTSCTFPASVFLALFSDLISLFLEMGSYFFIFLFILLFLYTIYVCFNFLVSPRWNLEEITVEETCSERFP